VRTSAADLAETRRLLGREPRRYDEYVQDQVAARQLEARTPEHLMDPRFVERVARIRASSVDGHDEPGEPAGDSA